MKSGLEKLESYKDKFEQKLFSELEHEFRHYRHFNIGLRSLLQSLIYNISEEALMSKQFHTAIKYELKLIMSYLHMVEDRNLIRDLKASFFPMLLLGAAGNTTTIKQVILATHLSAKAMPFIAETLQAILARNENHNPELIAELYKKILVDIRYINNWKNRVKGIADANIKKHKYQQLSALKLRRKNRLRKLLAIPILKKDPDDPYRMLPLFIKNRDISR